MKTKFRGTTPIITVRDISRSVDFYVNSLGFKLDFIYGEPNFYAGLYRDDVEIHLIDKNSPYARQPAGNANLSILTDEVDNLYDNLKDQGVVVLGAPEDRDYGLRDFSCKDLDGNIFNFGVESD